MVNKKATPKDSLKSFYEEVSKEFDLKKLLLVTTKEVMITVEKDGTLSNFKVLKDEFGIEEEVIRV